MSSHRRLLLIACRRSRRLLHGSQLKMSFHSQSITRSDLFTLNLYLISLLSVNVRSSGGFRPEVSVQVCVFIIVSFVFSFSYLFISPDVFLYCIKYPCWAHWDFCLWKKSLQINVYCFSILLAVCACNDHKVGVRNTFSYFITVVKIYVNHNFILLPLLSFNT